MTTETDHGYKIPELGDVDFFTSWNFNFERLDGHGHDGESGSPILLANQIQDENNRLVTDDQIAKWDNLLAPGNIRLMSPSQVGITTASDQFSAQVDGASEGGSNAASLSICQEFIAKFSTIRSVVFRGLKDVADDLTGNAVMGVYNSVAGEPTGVALGLSSAIDVADWTTDMSSYHFFFPSDIALVADQDYVVTLNMTGVSGTNWRTLIGNSGQTDPAFDGASDNLVSADFVTWIGGNPGKWSIDIFDTIKSPLLVLSDDIYVRSAGLTPERNTILSGSYPIPEGETAYVVLNEVAGVPANLTVVTAPMENIPLGSSVFNFATTDRGTTTHNIEQL